MQRNLEEHLYAGSHFTVCLIRDAEVYSKNICAYTCNAGNKHHLPLVKITLHMKTSITINFIIELEQWIVSAPFSN